jgi:molybdopterin molybdotransferase
MSTACCTGSSVTKFATPAEAIEALKEKLSPVRFEGLPLAQAAGRVLAASVLADRDSPPCDVSAMDGFAVRLDDLVSERIPVEGEAFIGAAPATLPFRRAMRVFTGAPVPLGAEAVIPREKTEEHPSFFILRIPRQEVKAGDHIRRQGENTHCGRCISAPGYVLDSSRSAALAAFGSSTVCVYRKLRVGVLPTGNELRSLADRVADWQIRDSNGPALQTALSRIPWLEASVAAPVADDPATLRHALELMLRDSDAVLLTGGVSKGDHDHVRATVESVGGTIIFHGLPIRPGKPVLGALGPEGQLILGLPGNPLAVLVTARCFGLPLLGRRAGGISMGGPDKRVLIAEPDDQTLPLQWYRLARETGLDTVELVPNRGSGDIPAAAFSDGVVEVPPGISGAGPFPFYRWL